LDAGNVTLQRLGRYYTVFGAAAAIAIVGTSVYVCLTAYGAWAVEKFIGKEMFNLILTDDPVNWPWSAYINLPLLPISLILSRFSSSSSSFVIPLLLVWPPAAPVGEPARKLYEFWSKPENAKQLARLPFLSPFGQEPKFWPPPPVLFGLFGVPIVKSLYKGCYAWLYKKMLGVPMPKPRQMPRGGMMFNEGPFVIRIRAGVDGQAGEGAQNDGEGQQEPPQPQPAVENGLDLGEANPNVAAVEAAEELIEINASSLGRRVGGALMIPAISSMMGTLLFRLSKHSSLLRAFLGVQFQQPQQPTWVSALLGGGPHTTRGGGASDDDAFVNRYPLPPWGRLIASPYASDGRKAWNELSRFQQTKIGLKLMMNSLLGGSRTWAESDPVWWRNAVGFALFIAVKDCVQLLHLWLAKRELESRRVKDRDFSGVDIRELDLLPSFPRAA